MKSQTVAACLACSFLSTSAIGTPGNAAEPSKKPVAQDISRDKELLVDKNQTPENRAAAAKRLRAAELKDAKVNVLPDLLKSIKGEPDPKTRVEIINAAIGIINRYKLPYPIEMVEPLFDRDANVRSLTSSYVGWAGSAPNMYESAPPEALPLLLKAARHEDSQVRIGAIDALSYIHVDSKSVLPELTNALHDKTYSVRNSAAFALWRMTKQADLVVPAFAALMGSSEPLSDSNELGVRSLTKWSLWMNIENKVREKPDDVTSELIRCLHSRSPDVQRGGRLLSVAFLKGKDAKLAAKRKAVQEELDRLGKGLDDEIQTEVNRILGSVKSLPQKPEGGKPETGAAPESRDR